MDDRERTAEQTSEERTAEVVEEPAKADFSKMNKSELKEVCERGAQKSGGGREGGSRTVQESRAPSGGVSDPLHEAQRGF